MRREFKLWAWPFGLATFESDWIHFVIPTSPNHRNSLFGLVAQEVFGTDCLYICYALNLCPLSCCNCTCYDLNLCPLSCCNCTCYALNLCPPSCCNCTCHSLNLSTPSCCNCAPVIASICAPLSCCNCTLWPQSAPPFHAVTVHLSWPQSVPPFML